jgi:putative PIN family toxin of toxin-antitoxin system
LKIALDTNGVVSAVATRGLCADLVQLILLEHELVVGETVLAELREVLGRKLKLPQTTIDEVESFLRRRAIVIAAGERRPVRDLDAADAAVVAEALAASADALVTGDGDLLRLPGSRIKIVSPRGLWDLLRSATLYIASSSNWGQIGAGDSPCSLGSARPSVSEGVARRLDSSQARTVGRGREPACGKVGTRRGRARGRQR